MITLDSSKWSDQAKRLLRNTGRDAGEVLKQEGRLFLQDLTKLTPPTNKRPFTESYNAQRRAGEQAIENDIKRVFIDCLSLGIVKNNPKLSTELQKYASNNNIEKATVLLRRIGVKAPITLEATAGLHAGVRGAGGRTRRGKKYIVLKSASIPRLIKLKQKLTGLEKAGWAQAASALGVKLPAWITRHNSPGLWRDETSKTENPSITMGNLVGYAQEHGRRLAIIKRALDRRAESLKTRLDHMLTKNFRE